MARHYTCACPTESGDDLLTGMTAGNVCVFRAGAGNGKTSVLRWMQAKLGGSIVAADSSWHFSRSAPPRQLRRLSWKF